MPYISPKDRDRIWSWENGAGIQLETPGELNYAITVLINNYLESKGKYYSSINEVVGVLECAKLEFYRRIAAPYEDQKKHDNGDVYSV